MPQLFLSFFGIFHCASAKIELQTFAIQSVTEVDSLGFEMCPETMSNGAFSDCHLIEPRDLSFQVLTTTNGGELGIDSISMWVSSIRNFTLVCS